MPKHDNHLTGLMRISLTPDLERAFKKRAKELKINPPDLARIALAIIAERGVSFNDTDDRETIDSSDQVKKRPPVQFLAARSPSPQNDERLYDFIMNYKSRCLPSYRQMADALGLKSTSSIRSRLDRLVSAGRLELVTRDGKRVYAVEEPNGEPVDISGEWPKEGDSE